jgi:hypothetical protein
MVNDLALHQLFCVNGALLAPALGLIRNSSAGSDGGEFCSTLLFGLAMSMFGCGNLGKAGRFPFNAFR